MGLALSAVLTIAGHPLLGLVAALLAGAAAGCVTGLLHTKLEIHPILSGILTMSGLYSINLLAMGNSSNLSLINSNTIFKIAINAFTLSGKRRCKVVSRLCVYRRLRIAFDFIFQNSCRPLYSGYRR